MDRLVANAEFVGKTNIVGDLTTRADNQVKNFKDREAAERVEANFDNELTNAISEGADALYTLEKRLLERFPRDRVYVRAFFFDAGAKRKKTVTD